MSAEPVDIPCTRVRLCWHRPLPGRPAVRARQLRGALADAFRSNDLFHQHTTDGQLLYRYPQIQYRWRDGEGHLIGWSQGAEVLLNLPWTELLQLRLGQDEVRVREAILSPGRATFAPSPRLHRYVMQSPVLLLNQERYAAYRELSPTAQRQELDRLLVAQLLTTMRGLNHHFPERLFASFQQAEPVPCPYKNQTFLGHWGAFVCNALLPPGLGIGHATSHGCGWIEEEEEG